MKGLAKQGLGRLPFCTQLRFPSQHGEAMERPPNEALAFFLIRGYPRNSKHSAQYGPYFMGLGIVLTDDFLVSLWPM